MQRLEMICLKYFNNAAVWILEDCQGEFVEPSLPNEPTFDIRLLAETAHVFRFILPLH